MTETLFKCRIEELPFLGNILLQSFNRDKSEFIAFSPDYNDPFTTSYEAQIKVVSELVAPKKLIGEQKKITLRLNDHFTRTRNLMNKMQRYVEKASDANADLSLAVNDFGIKAVRNEVNSKNDEGVVLKLKMVRDNFAANRAVLEAKGYTTAVQGELDALINDIATDSLVQTQKIKEREQLVIDNMGQLNKLWLMIDDLLKTGKSIWKEKDKSRVKDYTYTDLIKSVQMKRSKEEPVAAKA